MSVHLQLTLVRHGETDSNKSKILQGQKDTELSEYGREQCRLVGQRIASTETVSHIISSDLIRTVKTAELIRCELANQVEITMDTRIRERGFGSLEGQPLSQLKSAAKMAGVRVNEYTPIGGETLEDIDNRVSAFLSDLFSKYSKMTIVNTPPIRDGGLLLSSLPQPNWHVVLVTHGGVIHAVCEQFRKRHGCQLPERRNETPNTSITSFLLTLQDDCCLAVHTLTAHNTQHIISS